MSGHTFLDSLQGSHGAYITVFPYKKVLQQAQTRKGLYSLGKVNSVRGSSPRWGPSRHSRKKLKRSGALRCAAKTKLAAKLYEQINCYMKPRYFIFAPTKQTFRRLASCFFIPALAEWRQKLGRKGAQRSCKLLPLDTIVASTLL